VRLNIIKKLLVIFTIIIVVFFYITGTPTDIKGECSKFNMSYVYFGDKALYKGYVERTSNSLNVISPNYFNLNEDGSLKLTDKIDTSFIREMHEIDIKVVPFLSNHWDRELGREALKNRKALVEEIVQAIKNYNLDGVNIDIENLTHFDRDSYVDFVKLLREKLPKDKEVSIAVAANPMNLKWGWHGSYDYKRLAEYCDYLMIMAYDESYYGSSPGPVASISFVEKSIKVALQEVEPDKIVLGIPFYGRYWNLDENKGGYGIDLVKVNELIEKYNGRVVFDEKYQSPKAEFKIQPDDTASYVYGRLLKPGKYVVWFENEYSIKEKLRLVQKYNLKGTGSWSLGQEPPSTWQYYNLWLNGKYFKDVEGHWAEEAIITVENRGWMKGTHTEYFSPNKNLTRAQAAVTFVRVLGLTSSSINSTYFEDVPNNHWAFNEIMIAKEYGIFKGIDGKKFAPDEPITREQMAVLLERIINIEYEKDPEIKFKDIRENRWSYNSIEKLVSLGIFKGYTDGTFRPTFPITRAQMAALLNRISPMIETITDENLEDSE
jgi:spore germination protein YaaH